MEEIFGGVVFVILNFIGGFLRWIYGSIWRTIFNKPKFTFDAYINGPKKSKDYFDQMSHNYNNKIIAVVFIIVIVSLIIKFT